MSNTSKLAQEDVIDFSAPSPKTPPPPSGLTAVDEEGTDGNEGGMNRAEVINSPEPIFQSPTASLLRRGANNGVTSPVAAGKPTSQSIYLRVMGRKPGTNPGDVPNAKPFKATPINYSIMGLFSKESNEVCIRSKISQHHPSANLSQLQYLVCFSGAANQTHAQKL